MMSAKSERTRALLRKCESSDLDPHIVSYFQCFDEGRFYEAHDVLEAMWLPIRHSVEGDFFKGWIQLAGAFVLVDKERLAPALRLLRRARAHLRPYSGWVHGLEVSATLALIDDWEARLALGNALPFFQRSKPQLPWSLHSGGPSTGGADMAQWRAMDRLTASTRFLAVFGRPIRHSASPAMHNPALRELGLNWRYLAMEVAPESLREAIDGARAMGFLGINLTVPHKLLAVDYVDELDASGARWGAVNTLRFEGRERGGAWIPLGQAPDGFEPTERRVVGFNTDADAVIRAISEDLGLSLGGKRVVLLGAGGAGRVAALRLAQEGVKALALINRTREKSAAIAEEIRRDHPEVEVFTDYLEGGVDLVLNATSLGLKADDPSPIDTERLPFSRVKAAYDMIYSPAETPFLRAAREAGLPTANGLGMLLYQGAAALEIWTGQPAPVAVMARALREAIYGE